MSSSPRAVLHRAPFDPKLKLYNTLAGALLLAAIVIGLPLLPLWLIFAWFWWAPRSFEALQCDLTERALVVRKGVLFKVEKTIPLEKIQDLSLRHGPLLNALGLASITVETAGQSSGGTGGDAVLTGIIDARAFRDTVLAQRDALDDTRSGTSRETAAAVPATDDAAGTNALLREIRDTLQRIESRLGDRT